MANTLDLKIIAPDRIFFEGKAEFVEFNTSEGYVGIYPKHLPTTLILAPGVLRITEEGGNVKEAALHEGFAEVLGDRITMLAETVEWPDEIDLHRAEEERIRLERKIEDNPYDSDSVELALKKSIIRIQMAEKGGK